MSGHLGGEVLRIVLIDDEPDARRTLRNLLNVNCPGIVVVGEADGVQEALALLQTHAVDLLLLDVEMQDGTGFDLLDLLPAHFKFKVVFTTAFNEFAIRAFRYNAMDYLLKPIDPDELVRAIHKAQQNTNQVHIQQQIANLIVTTAQQSFERITLDTSEGLVFVHTQDITRLESYGNYTFVFLASGERCLVSRNLKEFEEMLLAPRFFRPHQSYMVNTSFVKKILKEDGGYALMQDGTKVPIARRKKDAFLQILTA